MVDAAPVAPLSTDDAPPEGYLLKRGAVNKLSWRRRWCVAADDKILYYKDSSLAVLIGRIRLADITVKCIDDHTRRKNGFGFEVTTERRVWQFVAESEADRTRWLQYLSRGVFETYSSALMRQAEAAISLARAGVGDDMDSPIDALQPEAGDVFDDDVYDDDDDDSM